MEYSANDDSEEEKEMVTSAEWVQNSKKPVTCPFGKKEPELPKPTKSLTCYCQKG